MRTVALITILLAASMLIASCGNGTLSISEARKQIEQQRNGSGEATNIVLYKGLMLHHGSRTEAENRYALVNKGKKYVTVYLNVIDDLFSKLYEVKDIELKEAAKPFVKIEPDRKVVFTAGTLSIDIRSIAEPVPFGGVLMCQVQYKEVFAPNGLGKDIDFHSCKNPDEEKTAVFVKMQDGWKLQQKNNDSE